MSNELGERLAIGGGPHSGKTTLGGNLARHTDDLIGQMEWSAASEEVAKWFSESGTWTIEGVAVARALRKWLVSNPKGKPCDRIIYLHGSFDELKLGQEAMSKGCRKVWDEIRDDLIARGVTITEMSLVAMKEKAAA